MFADTNQWSDYYVRTVPIERVYSHRLGFRIVYRNHELTPEVFYVPNAWTRPTGQAGTPLKAETVFGTDPAYPYFSIFWLDGNFSHVRLYLPRSRNHHAWGSMPSDWTPGDNFDIEALELRF